MTPKKLHDACVKAVQQCPQCDYDDEHNDAYCKSYGEFYDNGKPLYKKGMFAVINYWKNPKTIGGNLLWDIGYYQCLPKKVQELFDKVDEITETAIKNYFEKGK